MMRRIGALTILLLVAVALPGQEPVRVDVDRTAEAVDERQRGFTFLLDWPGLLLGEEEQERLRSLDEEERRQWIEEFLGEDPIPETELNELEEWLRRRLALARQEFLGFLDDRAKVLFLLGSPADRHHVDCDMAFKPLVIWSYGVEEEKGPRLVFYQPRPNEPYRLWLPLDSKRVLYTTEMEYWLVQWEELRGRISGRRFDYQICDDAKLVDKVTGVSGLFGYSEDRPTTEEMSRYLEAPDDLAQWARRAAETPVEEGPGEIPVRSVSVVYPHEEGQRMAARMTLVVPTEGVLEPYVEGEQKEYRVAVEGIVEHRGRFFEDFRMRYQVGVPEETRPIALVVERLFRPNREFVVRLKVMDEISGRQAFLSKDLTIPSEPDDVEEIPVPDEVIFALGERLAVETIPGKDSLVLVPPESDVVLGLWRADALVTGSSVEKVTFFVDGDPQLTRTSPPWSAELRLSKYPTEQVIRAEGYDSQGELVAADEVILNQQRGELRVSVVEPPRGSEATGTVEARAEIVVPEERRVAQVDFLVNDELQVSLEKPPWQTRVEIPAPESADDITYLTVVARLDNGAVAEDVRFLHVPTYFEQVEVDLVELYTTVTDKSGRLVRGLGPEDFQVFEDGRPQEIAKFELVEDLPLTLGISIDTSGSMLESLGEAKRAAVDFLDSIITPKDRSFAVSFANHPVLLMPRTSDVGAVEEALDDLTAVGMTSLYDAIVTSLYYFRGVRGRRALVLLSDGEDTASTIPWRDSLEYARRSGVAIFTIGLNIGKLQFDVRNKLNELSQETGGRSFYISKAGELMGVYEEIERELRSQYLIAYNSDRPKSDSEFRTVEVKVKGKLKARTIRGYYP